MLDSVENVIWRLFILRCQAATMGQETKSPSGKEPLLNPLVQLQDPPEGSPSSPSSESCSRLLKTGLNREGKQARTLHLLLNTLHREGEKKKKPRESCLLWELFPLLCSSSLSFSSLFTAWTTPTIATSGTYDCTFLFSPTEN